MLNRSLASHTMRTEQRCFPIRQFYLSIVPVIDHERPLIIRSSSVITGHALSNCCVNRTRFVIRDALVIPYYNGEKKREIRTVSDRLLKSNEQKRIKIKNLLTIFYFTKKVISISTQGISILIILYCFRFLSSKMIFRGL